MSKARWTREYLEKILKKSLRPKMSDMARTAGVSRQRIFSVLGSLKCSIVDGKLVYNEE